MTEKLVCAWVDQLTHFGNTATLWVEGIHTLLKSYLKRSTFDLFETWKAICLALPQPTLWVTVNTGKTTDLNASWAFRDSIQSCMRMGISWVIKEGWGAMEVTGEEQSPPPISNLYRHFLSSLWAPMLTHIRCSLRQGSSTQPFPPALAFEVEWVTTVASWALPMHWANSSSEHTPKVEY